MKIVPTKEEKEKMIGNPWLTDRQRDIFELVYRRGYTRQEAANELAVSPKTIYRELAEIRKGI